MARQLGTLTIDLIAKLGGFVSGMTEAERVADSKTRDMQRKLDARAKAIEKSWDNVGKAISAGIAGITIGSVIGTIISETRQTEKEQAHLAAVLRSTGESAGWSAQKLNEMAGAMSSSTTFSEGQINQAQTRLLKFTSITGKEVPLALQAAMDMAARTGMELPEAMDKIGRALQSPKDGLTALRSELPKFTDDQKALVEKLQATGKTAQAQTIILNALESAYGGSAEAARGTFGGSIDALKNQLSKLMTADGGTLPGATQAVNDLTATLGSEETRAAFNSITGAVITLTAKVIEGIAKIAEFTNQVGTGLGIAVAQFFHGSDDVIGQIDEKIDHWSSRLATANARIKAPKWGDDLAVLTASAKQATDELERLRKLRADMIRDAQNAPPPQKTTGFTKPTLGSAPDATGAAARAKAEEAAQRSREQAAKQAGDYIRKLREMAAGVREMTNVERLHYDMQAGQVQFASKSQAAEAERLAVIADLQKSGADMLKRQNELREEGRRLTDAMLSPLQKLAKEEEHINELLAGGHINAGTAALAIQDARAKAFGIGNDVEAWIKGDVSPLSGGKFDDQSARYDAEGQKEKDRYAAQLQRLQQALEQQKITQKAYWDDQEKFAQEHADRMAQIERAKSDLMLTTMAGGFGQMANDLSAFAKQFGVKNKEMLAAMKAAAIAQTIIQTYQSAQAAYASMAGIPYVGPALGVAAAAAAIAGGMARVAAIRNQDGFADGGYTGPGGKYDVAGFVHRGEVVWSQSDIARAGGVGVVEAMRNGMHAGLRGYANGGVVGVVPAVARNAVGAGNGGVTVNVPVSVTSAGGGTAASPEALASMGSTLSRAITPVVQEIITREQRPGGRLWAWANGRA